MSPTFEFTHCFNFSAWLVTFCKNNICFMVLSNSASMLHCVIKTDKANESNADAWIEDAGQAHG